MDLLRFYCDPSIPTLQPPSKHAELAMYPSTPSQTSAHSSIVEESHNGIRMPAQRLVANHHYYYFNPKRTMAAMFGESLATPLWCFTDVLPCPITQETRVRCNYPPAWFLATRSRRVRTYVSSPLVAGTCVERLKRRCHQPFRVEAPSAGRCVHSVCVDLISIINPIFSLPSHTTIGLTDDYHGNLV